MIFYGKITLNGSTAPAGTKVQAIVDGCIAQEASTDAQGVYVLQLSEAVPGQYMSKNIGFRIAGVNTNVSVPYEGFGGGTRNFTVTKTS